MVGVTWMGMGDWQLAASDWRLEYLQVGTKSFPNMAVPMRTLGPDQWIQIYPRVP